MEKAIATSKRLRVMSVYVYSFPLGSEKGLSEEDPLANSNPYIRAIEFLEEAEVDYVIVGGFAVVMHGCNRFTPDLNVMVSHESEGLKKLCSLLVANDFIPATDPDPMILCDPNLREQFFANGKRWFFSFRDMEEPSFSLDLFLKFPVPFQQVYERKQIVEFANGSHNICSLEDLIAMKSMAGRGQDKADIGALNLIKQIIKEIESGADEEKILTLAENDTEQERLVGFYRFMKLSSDEKLEWLGEMLNHLGKFCVA